MNRSRLLSSAALSVLMAAITPGAYAQETEEATESEEASPLEEIIVTGLKRISRPMTDTKKESFAVMDTLNFEQIELLPDSTLVEVIDRIPGASSVTYNSQARWITLRGLDARYNSTDIDGNPIWNSSRNNRGTQLDVFPSSAINQVDVFKAVTPDIDANSVGGHISVRTLRAFDGGTDPFFKAKAQYGYYDQSGLPDSGKTSYKVNAAGKFTFGADNRLGIVYGFDAQQHEYYQLSGRTKSGYENIGGVELPKAQTNYHASTYQTDIDRQSVFAKIEARATDQLYTFFAINYFVEGDVESYNRTGFFGRNYTAALADGLGETGEATAQANFIDYFYDRDTILYAMGLDYRFGDVDVFSLRGSITQVDLKEDWFQSATFENAAGWGMTHTFDLRGSVPRIDTHGIDYSDPAAYRQKKKKKTWNQADEMDDTLSSIRLDWSHNTHPNASGLGYKTGISWRQLDRDFKRDVWRLSLPFHYYLSNLQPGLTAVNPQNTIFIDHTAYWDYMNTNGTRSDDLGGDYGTDYDLVEDVFAGYGMFVYATDRFRVNAGLRFEATNFTNDAFALVDTDNDLVADTAVPERREKGYANVLPNIHFVYNHEENVKLRWAYTKTLGRPDFADFAQGTSIVSDGIDTSISIGNPDLDPRVSDNFDFSAEYYFLDVDGLLSFGVFYKDIENETFTQIQTEPDLGTGGIITTATPLNSGSANLFGIEMAFMMERFDFLPAPFDGLGVFANYTYLDGEWNVTLSDGSSRTVGGLRNQPKHLANLTLLYNWNDFGASLAYNYRGKAFTGDFGDTSINDIWVDTYGRLDAQVKYAVTDNLTIVADARNLNDEEWLEQTGSSGDLFSRYFKPGPSFWLGFKYKR